MKAVLVYGIFSKELANILECNPNNEKNWMGWTKKELERRGFEVTCPVISEVWQSTYPDWKKELDKINIDDNTVMVGLIAGAGAITKFIVEKKKKIRKLILIAPARYHPDRQWATFYDFEISDDVKKQIIDGTAIFYDSKDWDLIQESVEIYKKELDASVVELSGRGHFSFEMPILPELLDEILRTYHLDIIGLKKGTVKLSKHNSKWKELFEKEKTTLLKKDPELIIDVIHVGSTAIKNMPAKPIIDMVVGVKSLDDNKKIIKVIESAGFQYDPDSDFKGRMFFIKGSDIIRTHHLSVVVHNSKIWNNYEAFVDRLNNDPKLVMEYCELKKRLAEEFKDDRMAYTSAKADYIEKVLKSTY